MGLKWKFVKFESSILSVRKGLVLGKEKDPKTENSIRDTDITIGMKKSLIKQKSILI